MVIDVNRPPVMINIGRQTETGVTQITFDCSAWLEQWPGLMLSAVAVRPGEAEAYPVVSRQEGGQLTWAVNAADTAIAGCGSVEVIGTAEGVRKLSAVFRTRIFESAASSEGEPPEAARPWVDEVLDAAKRAEEAAKRAENAGGSGGGTGGLTVDSEGNAMIGGSFTVDADGNATIGDFASDKIDIKTLNGHPLADEVSREAVSENAANIERLTEEIGKINNDLDNIPTGKIAPGDTTFFLIAKNLFNPDTITEKHYINQTNGKAEANAYYHASDYIQVSPATTYELNSGSESRYAFYDTNKNYISGEYIITEAPIELVSPTNAEYFRFSYQEWKNLSAISFAVAGIAVGDKPYINPEYIRLDTHSFPLNLPAKLYALVGEELNVWFDNLVDGHDTDYVFEANCSVGMQLERCYRLTAEEAGEYNLTIKATDKHGASVTKTTKIIAAAADAGSGETTSVIVLGDSTTANSIAVGKVVENFSGDAMAVSMLGTRGVGTNKHEGRSGWTFKAYFDNAADSGDSSVVNAFYNPTTQTFDAAYYFANSGVSAPEWFFINLGINDNFSFYDDETLAANITALNTYCDQMIASLKAAVPGIRIGVCLTIPPNYSQDAFGKEYKCGQTRNRYKRNNVLWVENLIEKYDGRENERIYLVPIHTNLDTKYGMSMEEIPHSKRNAETYFSPYGNGGVHPDTDGYWQIADVYWFFLKAHA